MLGHTAIAELTLADIKLSPSAAYWVCSAAFPAQYAVEVLGDQYQVEFVVTYEVDIGCEK